MVLSALFGALTFLGYFISLPIGPVPITLQTLFVLLAGFLLERKAAALAMTVHLLLKLLTSGAAAFMSPAFGFAVTFIPAAFLISHWSQPVPTGAVKAAALAGIATLLIYAIGIGYMTYILNVVLGKNLTLMQVLSIGMLSFIPGDILKAALAIALSMRLQRTLRRA